MVTESPIITKTELSGVPLAVRGKVRDVFDLGTELLFVATDRISAFDYILASGIPDKGRVLTQLSLFWFGLLEPIVPNHVVTADLAQYPAQLRRFDDQLRGRSMIVRKMEMVPIECVARGYLSGSGWKEYQQSGSVCGIRLPAGLRESDRLPEAIFTPAAKATSGHDENISFAEMVDRVGRHESEQLRDLTLRLYNTASRHALERGIIIADTKFEFGRIGGALVLGDEVFTPDSSRFWPADTYAPGQAQFSYDKQYVRDYLESIHWNKQPPAPSLPEEVQRKTSDKYKQAYRKLTGKDLLN